MDFVSPGGEQRLQHRKRSSIPSMISLRDTPRIVGCHCKLDDVIIIMKCRYSIQRAHSQTKINPSQLQIMQS